MSSNLFGHNTKYNFGDLKVLIVDDNQHMHNILRDMLLGMRIKKIRHGFSAKEGMQLAESELPDIMIVDLLMKPVDGFELIKKIRNHKDEAIRDLAVLVLTSYSTVEHVRRARDSGANEVLCKPVSVAGLFDRFTYMRDHPRQFVKTKDYVGPDRRRNLRGFDGEDRRANPTGANIADDGHGDAVQTEHNPEMRAENEAQSHE
jgi:DNA-binding response OmpR family regulator